ncbi:MAG: hypothetical protein WBV73_21405 [Phormidium sp.]
MSKGFLIGVLATNFTDFLPKMGDFLMYFLAIEEEIEGFSVAVILFNLGGEEVN